MVTQALVHSSSEVSLKLKSTTLFIVSRVQREVSIPGDTPLGLQKAQLGEEMKKIWPSKAFHALNLKKNKSQKHVATNVVWVYDMFNLGFYIFYKWNLGESFFFFFPSSSFIFFFIFSPF